jgi:hypothetical protein
VSGSSHPQILREPKQVAIWVLDDELFVSAVHLSNAVPFFFQGEQHGCVRCFNAAIERGHIFGPNLQINAAPERGFQGRGEPSPSCLDSIQHQFGSFSKQIDNPVFQ